MELVKFLLCVKNDEVEASLEARKVYQVVPDAQAETKGMVRIIDETGEDYFFPQSYFAEVQIDQTVIETYLLQALYSGQRPIDVT